MAAHERLLATASSVDDVVARQPSRLPGWTVGHVLTHIARNADGHTRRLEGALRGEDIPRYAGGMDERNAGIEAGALRPAADLATDLADSAHRLEAVWARSIEAGWPNGHFFGHDKYPITGIPIRRLREVEMHHVDLGLGYTPTDWPDLYVDWELTQALSRLPQRIQDPTAGRHLLAALTGRGDWPGSLELGPLM